MPGCETNHEGERRHPSCTAQRTAHLDEIFEGVRQVEHTPIEPRCEVHVCQQPCASIGLMNQLTMTYITSRLPHATISTLYHTRQPAPCTTYDNHLTAPHATGSTLHHIRQSAYCTLQHTRQAAQHTAYGQQSAHRALQTTVSTPRISYDNEHTASHTTVSTHRTTQDSQHTAHISCSRKHESSLPSQCSCSSRNAKRDARGEPFGVGSAQMAGTKSCFFSRGQSRGSCLPEAMALARTLARSLEMAFATMSSIRFRRWGFRAPLARR